MFDTLLLSFEQTIYDWLALYDIFCSAFIHLFQPLILLRTSFLHWMLIENVF